MSSDLHLEFQKHVLLIYAAGCTEQAKKQRKMLNLNEMVDRNITATRTVNSAEKMWRLTICLIFVFSSHYVMVKDPISDAKKSFEI